MQKLQSFFITYFGVVVFEDNIRKKNATIITVAKKKREWKRQIIHRKFPLLPLGLKYVPAWQNVGH